MQNSASALKSANTLVSAVLLVCVIALSVGLYRVAYQHDPVFVPESASICQNYGEVSKQLSGQYTRPESGGDSEGTVSYQCTNNSYVTVTRSGTPIS